MQRRKFIGLALASVALTRCGGGGGGDSKPPVIPPVQTDPWQSLASQLKGKLIRPTDTDYNDARVVFNARFDHVMPQAIVRCANADDVVAALAYARKNAIPIVPRCGSHGYAGYSTSPGMVVDVSPMNSISVGDGTATIGAGARLVDVYDQLTAKGVAIPSGSCATVGIAGITLGGGIGVVDRAYGLTCDNLISADVVLADGRKVTASATSEPELFWALRGGGGGNFGVVTSFTFKTHATSDITTLETYFAFDDLERVMAAWQVLPRQWPDRIWGQVIVSWFNSNFPPGVYLRLFSLVSKEELDSHWAQFLQQTGLATFGTHVTTDTYRNVMLAACGSLSVEQCHVAGQSPKGMVSRGPFAASSDFFAQPVSVEGWKAFKQRIQESNANAQFGMVIMDLMGGVIDNVGPTETAFPHRNALFSAEYYTFMAPGTSAAVVDATQAWLHSFRDLMAPWSTGLAYVNYIDPLITNWKAAYYGNNYPRLTKVKTQYDPDQLFRSPQSIEPG